MAFRNPDRTVDATLTAGTGPFALEIDAPSTHRAFSDAVADGLLSVGDTFAGVIYHESLNEWQEGVFTYSDDNEVTTLEVTGGSNGVSAVSFSSGVKRVACVAISAVMFASAMLSVTNRAVLGGPNGGTGSAFFQVAGPASTLKTYTLPNVDEAIATLGQTQEFSGAKTFSAVTTVSNATQSTATNNGALVVTGGLGVGNGMHVFGASGAGGGMAASFNKLRDATNGWRYAFLDTGGLTSDAAGGAAWRGFFLNSPFITDPSGGANVFPSLMFYGEYDSLTAPALRNWVVDMGNVTATTLHTFRLRSNFADILTANTSAVTVPQTTASTSVTTGALLVGGGVGVSGQVTAQSIGVNFDADSISAKMAVDGGAAVMRTGLGWFFNNPANDANFYLRHEAHGLVVDWNGGGDLLTLWPDGVVGLANSLYSESSSVWTPGVVLRNHSTDEFSPANLSLERTRNFGAVSVNDRLGAILFKGFDTTPQYLIGSAIISTATAVGSGFVAANLEFILIGASAVTISSSAASAYPTDANTTFNIPFTVPSSSKTTGALTVAGGVGIGGQLSCAGVLVDQDAGSVTVRTTGSTNGSVTIYDTADGGWTIFQQDGTLYIAETNTSGIWVANHLQIDNNGNSVFSGTISAAGGKFLFGTDSNGQFEFGVAGAGTPPYMDWHSSSFVTDYDARIACTGGTATAGQGTLAIEAGTLNIVAALLKNGSTVLTATTANEWSGVTEKAAPLAAADLLLMEDSAASAAKKRVRVDVLRAPQGDVSLDLVGGSLATALAALPAGGGIIRVPPGLWDQTATASRSDIDRLAIVGPGALRWTSGSGGLSIAFATPDGGNLHNERLLLSDVAWLTTQASPGIAVAVSWATAVGDSSRGCAIKDCDFSGQDKEESQNWTTGVTLTNCRQAAFSRCIFEGRSLDTTMASGVRLLGGTVSTQFSDCAFTHIEKGLEVLDECEGVYVRNTDFVTCTQGIVWVADSEYTGTYLVVSGSHGNCFTNFIYADRVAHGFISDCLAQKRDESTNNYTDIKLAGNCDIWNIHDNFFQLRATSGTEDGVVVESGCNNVYVHHNMFANRDKGIWFNTGSVACFAFGNRGIGDVATLYQNDGTSNTSGDNVNL